MNGRTRWGRGIGLRREVVILLPVAFLLLVVLSIFTLFAYRSGVSLLVEERRGEALTLARRVAAEAAAGALEDQALRRLAPTARGVAVIAADGRLLARTGDLPEGAYLAPLGDAAPGEAHAFGPGDAVDDAVAAFAPVPAGGEARWVRVDLGAPALALQRRGLGVLTWLVLGVDGALVILVLLFLGRLLAPYDALLDRARSAGEVPPEAEDEVAFLVATFERALAALARPPASAREGDPIPVLQRTLAASFESGVLLLDRDGAALAINPAGGQLLEVEPLEAGPRETRPLAEVLPGHPGLVRLLGEAVAEGRGVRRQEIETVTRSGRHLTLGLTVHPLKGREAPGDSPGESLHSPETSPGREGVPSPPLEAGERVRTRGGEALGYLVLFLDLTEVRRRREQAHLAESLSQIGELAAGVAHELRNSLATLKGYLTLVERAGRGEGAGSAEEEGGDEATAAGGPVAEYVGEIRRETDHLQRVLEDFLSFARPGTVRLEEVDLYQVLARAAADPVLAGVRVRLAPRPPAPLQLSGDAQLLERAFRNLLHNAAEAARAGGGDGGSAGAGPEVEAAAGATADGLEVTVADRGPGIPEALRERLFLPFASGRAGGVGLGLALARRILVLHGGALALEDRPGGGTVARARLPAGGIVTEGNELDPEEGGPEVRPGPGFHS